MIVQRTALWMCLALVLWATAESDAVTPTGSDPRLAEIRASRAAAMRVSVAAKANGDDPAPFGLLVIPVDFADQRFPGSWDTDTELGPRLFPQSGESLANFFHLASRGQAEMRIVLAPTVSLPDNRAYYSDIGLNGFTRTRELATLAIQAVSDLGIDFRQLDIDGPDHLPGSPDDDGQVDGVLILHAGVGTENDSENGRVMALQYFLDQPVVNNGTAAVSYAVASQQSGLGIWAHETGHLLGLGERYDPFLPTAAGDVLSRGGLGRFSAMSSGAWGAGDGSGPALLDAYSCLQLGWCSVTQLRGAGSSRVDTVHTTHANGQVYRIWTQGTVGTEYFLLETRGDPAVLPFDADIPSGQLLIYHVDETVPEGSSSGGQNYHLRVRLVEADDDGMLADGLDNGSTADLFPGSLARSSLTSSSIPSSYGYTGSTEVALTQITSLAAGVSLTANDATAVGHHYIFSCDEQTPAHLTLEVWETGLPFLSAAVEISVLEGQQWGEFTSGETSEDINLVQREDGAWILGASVTWTAVSAVPAGAETIFGFSIRGTSAGGDWAAETTQRQWVWAPTDDPLDFSANWQDGGWEIVTAETTYETTWHLWSSAPYITADDEPVLICTGDSFTTSAEWTTAQYFPGADTALLSPLLSGPLAGVLLIHAIDCEMLRTDIAMDGGVAEWVLPDGSVVPAIIDGGYPAHIDSRSGSVLHDRAAFAGNDSLTASGVASWRLDFIAAPAGPGPVRLRLHFAANNRAIDKGWIIKRLVTLSTAPVEGVFPLAISENGGQDLHSLVWSLHEVAADSFAVEMIAPDQAGWQETWRGIPEAGNSEYDYQLPLTTMTSAPADNPAGRNLFRIVALAACGRINSRPQVYFRDGGAPTMSIWEPLYPNPATSSVRLLLDLPQESTAQLSLFDVSGRHLRNWSFNAGTRLLLWEGKDKHGQHLPAGIYFFRLTAAGQTDIQRVVWLR